MNNPDDGNIRCVILWPLDIDHMCNPMGVGLDSGLAHIPFRPLTEEHECDAVVQSLKKECPVDLSKHSRPWHTVVCHD